jgi:recombination protein RecA
MARRQLLPSRARRSAAAKAGDYFSSNKGIKFFSSGCQLLDNALGGGYAQGRIVNIVGDKSTGKTLLAIEACANFAMEYPKGLIRYKEAEAAFDKGYARVLGMPISRVEFEEDNDTVEELQKDLKDFAERCKKAKQPGLYIVDSLDALSDKAEQERDIEKGTYGATKAKLMSEMFRREKRNLHKAKITLMIVSQVRDKINAMFGRKWTRSGGRALDFYASQVMYLAEIKKLVKTVRGIKRPHGVVIRCKLTKNKVGIPFREVDFSLIFGYGIDDVLASLDWLKSVKALRKIGLPQGCRVTQEAKKIKAMPPARRKARVAKIAEAVRAEWIEIEEEFLPKETKY